MARARGSEGNGDPGDGRTPRGGIARHLGADRADGGLGVECRRPDRKRDRMLPGRWRRCYPGKEIGACRRSEGRQRHRSGPDGDHGACWRLPRLGRVRRDLRAIRSISHLDPQAEQTEPRSHHPQCDLVPAGLDTRIKPGLAGQRASRSRSGRGDFPSGRHAHDPSRSRQRDERGALGRAQGTATGKHGKAVIET